MEIKVMYKMFSFRLYLHNSKIIFPLRFYHEPQKLAPRDNVQKLEQEEKLKLYKPKSFEELHVKFWNEYYQIKKEKKNFSLLKLIKDPVDVIQILQNSKKFPLTFTEFFYYMKRRYDRLQLVEQKYLPARVAILKPDLAAAHFLLRRGGSVKFMGQSDWVGIKEKRKTLPMVYIPGILVEGIKAEGTELYFEGLQNLAQLKHLTYLSLKNLGTMNDWCLDYISKEHHLNLKHLDISGCKNVTYRGLSCFYRFENLETLEVNDVSDTPEFKLACLMLLDIMPNLNITGIDLTVPKKIDPVTFEEIKEIQST